jgi:hypothetical protein
MKAATIQELKVELNHLSAVQLSALCARLARFKKENKEFLTYLLFEAGDEQGYIENVKTGIDDMFAEIPRNKNLYLIKKSLRKILRITNKHIRYTGSKAAEVQLRLHYCSRLKESGIPINKSAALTNLFQAQLKKINKILLTLHEDLQYDYSKDLQRLS